MSLSSICVETEHQFFSLLKQMIDSNILMSSAIHCAKHYIVYVFVPNWRHSNALTHVLAVSRYYLKS